ncbi:MAG: alpha/beta hydrolase [Polyangiales bacterium]
MNLSNRLECALLLLVTNLVAGCAPSGDCVRTEAGPAVCEPHVVPQPDDLDASFRDGWHVTLAEAGIVERRVRVGRSTLYYAEGPASGPPLLLLHAQHMDWYSYSRVLPELARTFHVFAVSYHGHGLTESPVDHMDATHIGVDLTAFIEHVIGEPVFVTGNSSGGLLSLWLAANAPSWVRAVLLEDPPLFTSELPRSRETIAFRTFETCHAYLETRSREDFLLYWVASNQEFVVNMFGNFGYRLLVSGVETYRVDHPGERVELNFLPDIVRILVRGLDVYDPHFGDAFYDGSWSEGFDQAEALQRVAAPTLLLHANFEYLEDGTLNGALDDDDAARAMSLLAAGTYLRIDSEHVVHLDEPTEFVRIATEFFLGP